MAAYIGTENVVKMARSAGIETKHLPSDLSVALGAASLTPLEMAVAFNCFNNGGKRVTPLTIREIRDNEGNVLETRSPQLSQAMRPSTAYTIRSMLQDAVRAGTGTRARVPNVDTFGKTGTSNDFIDAWFVGGTPGLTTAVYVGNDDHTSMGRKGFGGTMAAPAWQAFMAYAVKEQKTPSSFANAPDWAEVTRVSICRNSGYLAAGGCPAVPLYFPSGKAPTAKCPYHGGSYEAADEDPRGPRLFLIEQDEAYLDNSAEESQEEHTTPQQVNPSVIPAPSAPAPYRHDPSPADEVEKRYQQLLKEYGID